MNSLLFHFVLKTTFFFSMILPFIAIAGVVVTGTRVIYPTEKKEVTVPIKNNGESPVLVQAWIDTGDPLTLPEKITSPFIIIPPILRLDKNAGHTLRLIYTGGVMPMAQESVFWLNVLTIPSKESKSDHHYIDVAYQTRIKIFFRPAALSIGPDAALQKLQWIIKNDGLFVTNPTPYFISLIDVNWNSGREEYSLPGGMISPYSDLTISQEKANSLQEAHSLNYRVINDNGAVMIFNTPLK